MRAGYSVLQGIEAVAQEVDEPMGSELRRVLAETRLGRPLEESLEVMAERLDSRDFAGAVMAVFLAICLAVYALVGSAEEKATIRESLRQLGGYEIENERDRELLNPLRERAVVPVVNWFTGIGRRLTPVGYVDNVRRKMTLA